MAEDLYLVKEPDALETLGQEAPIVLIQDAVRLKPNRPGKVFVLGEDADERGITPSFERIDYPRLWELVKAAASVKVW